MVSPPPHSYNSPPAPSGLALPRQRPQLALPTTSLHPQPRKPSSASSAYLSAHPLRQTSFPPSDAFLPRQYSPDAADSLDGFSDGDNDIRSAISGPTASDSGLKKRKRGEKRPRGRPAKNPRAPSLSVDEGRAGGGAKKGAHSVQTANDEALDAEASASEDDNNPAGTGRVPLYEGGQLSIEQQADERERKRVFYETVSEEHRMRLASFQRGKLRTADVRKLVNQVLGQSVPQNVVLVVSAYAKLFAGGVVEEARGVQGEWTAVDDSIQDNEALEMVRSSKRMKRDLEEGQTATVDPSQHTPPSQALTNNTIDTINTSTPSHSTPQLAPGGAAGLARSIHECDRGPLLPDHLREALRRHKKRRAGGPVGFTGLSLEGRENGASRMGGRRLFR
ncbi:hypothetical protein LTR08_006132 [Meristemomyces frigidus]|nr:hypothetical protein LTR08_006132 [Meristemomyces frigidus]